jgi:hypothetical protein
MTIGIGLQQRDLVSLQNIFQFMAFTSDQNFNVKPIPTFPCTR